MFISEAASLELDERGYVHIDMTDELEDISMATNETFQAIDWLTQSNTQAWLSALGLDAIPIQEFTND